MSTFATSAATAGQKRQRPDADHEDPQDSIQERQKFVKLLETVRAATAPGAQDALWKQEQVFQLAKTIKTGES